MILALLIGVVAGLRALTPLAVVSWAAHLGLLHLQGTWLAFLGHPVTAWIATVLALVELVTDKLPTTPSRKVPMQFGARIAVGALCGAALGLPAQMFAGLFAGVIGATIGTLGGAAFRQLLAKKFGNVPAALLEDVIAIGGAFLIVSRFA
jgi:uncharacterized membrane protein